MPSPQEYRIEKPPETRPPEAAAAPTLQADIGVACPTQVKPEVPPKAIQEGVAGTVRAQALISKGVVKEVRILSGPRVYHQAVRAAMLKYVCIASSDMLVQQEFDFRVE
jgi:protein TonB